MDPETMLPAHLRRSVPCRRQLAAALLTAFGLASASPAAALSRAMWAEFNTIYLINLKPAAECRPYRTRSIELLKDTSLSPAALDERMHALWNEAKANCLANPAPEQPSARQRPEPAAAQAVATAAAMPARAAAAAKVPEAAPVPAPAKPVVANPPVAAPLPAASQPAPTPAHPPVPAPAAAHAPAPAPAAAHAPAPAPAAAPASVPAPTASPTPRPSAAPTPPGPAAAGPITTAAVANAAAGEHSPATGSAPPGLPMQSTPGTKAPGDGRPPIALPQLKPAIERPLAVDLRLEAACAKRNPYAYQVASDDDPCAKLASAKAAKADPAATGEASPAPRPPAWVWPVVGVVLTALAGAGGWWFWRRRRSGTDSPSAAADHDAAGDEHAGQRPRPADDDAPPGHPHHDESLAPAMS